MILCTNRRGSSCGTLTTALTKEQPAGYYSNDYVQYCDKKQLSDTANYCNTTPYQDDNGHASGKVTFVYTDCKTSTPLKTGQDEAYDFPGVSTGIRK